MSTCVSNVTTVITECHRT